MQRMISAVFFVVMTGQRPRSNGILKRMWDMMSIGIIWRLYRFQHFTGFAGDCIKEVLATMTAFSFYQHIVI